MLNLKYTAYAVPCCMAFQGTDVAVVFAGMTALFLALILDW